MPRNLNEIVRVHEFGFWKVLFSESMDLYERKFKNGNCSLYSTLLGKLADAEGEVHHIGGMYGNWQGPLLGIAINTVFRGFTLFGSEILSFF